VLVVCVSAVSKIEKLKKRWDIAEGITGASGMGKVEGHEQSVRDAYNGLSASDKSVITNPTTPNRPYLEAAHTPTALIMGLQYPDMPIGGAKVSALGDDLTKPDHVTVGTFGSFFKAGSLGARNTFVSQTHYGCLQFWHAMAPEPYVGGQYKVWTNAVLSQLIKNGARRIWNVAVGHLKNNNKQMAEFHLGRILHTIGDSYAKGHTTRGPSSCGKIFIFQEYNAQKGNEAHGSGDKPATNADTFSCTVQRIKEVLGHWAGCVRTPATCTYPTIIDSTFDVDPSVAGNDAGGSLEFYAGPEAKSKGTKTTVTIAGQAKTVYFPATNGLTRVAGTADVAAACPAF
jgi:hypothetical protein